MVVLRIAGLAFGLFLATSVSASPTQPAFDALLEESGMIFRCGEGFRKQELQPNELLSYEHALRSDDDLLEIRFSVRPIARITIDYEDPHNAAPEPEHLFPLLFQSLVGRLSGGGHSPHQEYPPEQARTLFGADWAAASVFDMVPDYGSPFGQALLIAIHGNGRADGYSVFLFDDYEVVKERINASLGCLSFAPAKGGTEAVASDH